MIQILYGWGLSTQSDEKAKRVVLFSEHAAALANEKAAHERKVEGIGRAIVDALVGLPVRGVERIDASADKGWNRGIIRAIIEVKEVLLRNGIDVSIIPAPSVLDSDEIKAAMNDAAKKQKEMRAMEDAT